MKTKLEVPNYFKVTPDYIVFFFIGAADPKFFPMACSRPSGVFTPTPILKRAVDWGLVEAVSLLLAAGADPNQEISSCTSDFEKGIFVKQTMEKNRECCKTMVEEAKVNYPSLLSLKNRGWNVVSGLLYGSWKARSAHSESKIRDDDYEIHILKVTR